MQSKPLIRATEASLAAAVEENLFELFRAVVRLPGSEIVETERLNYHYSPSGGAMFKSSWNARLSADDVDSAIEEQIAWFEARGSAFQGWWFNNHPQPANLLQRLEAHGFELDYSAPGMVVPLDTLDNTVRLPDGFTVVPALDNKTLEDWANVLAASYDFSITSARAWPAATLALGPDIAPWRLYVGYWRGRPIATNMIFNGAGVSGLFCIGTIPEARGKGFGGAITIKPLLDARAEGYHHGVLFASEMGLPMYEKLGFRRVDIVIGRYVRRSKK